MGKSLGVIALAASDGGKISPLLKPNHDLKGKIQIKATVVVTSVSLMMGQWEDEVKKHTNLTCSCFHTSKSKYGNNLNPKCASISARREPSKFARSLGISMFNRVCVDEAHLLGNSLSMRDDFSVMNLFAKEMVCHRDSLHFFVYRAGTSVVLFRTWPRQNHTPPLSSHEQASFPFGFGFVV